MTQQAYPSPEYSGPGGGYPPPMPPRRGTNTMAVLALVFAFVFSPLGIVFGLIGRSQIKRTGESGRGLATAGLVLGIVFVVLGIAGAVAVAIVAATATPSVTAAQVQEQIVSQSSGAATDAQCPGSLEGTVGTTMTCTATVNGTPGQIAVTVTAVEDDTVKFDLQQVG